MLIVVNDNLSQDHKITISWQYYHVYAWFAPLTPKGSSIIVYNHHNYGQYSLAIVIFYRKIRLPRISIFLHGKFGACTDSVYQALFSPFPPPPKRLHGIKEIVR